jgi:hypothetical protein
MDLTLAAWQLSFANPVCLLKHRLGDGASFESSGLV